MNAVRSYVSSAVDNTAWVTEAYNFRNINIPAFLHSLYYHAFRERERDKKFCESEDFYAYFVNR
jgi:hypothetical protein